MVPIKLKKKTDDNNVIGFQEIIILDKILSRSSFMGCEACESKLLNKLYEYDFLAIADGVLCYICEEDLLCSLSAYEEDLLCSLSAYEASI